LKLARKVTHRPGIVAFEGGFHGRTFGALSVSWRDIYRQPFEPLLPGVTFIPYNNLAAAEAAIGGDTGAVIVEPIQGEGGVRVPSDDFLPGLRAICDRQGALLILDEVQTGFGRTGRFFACEQDLSHEPPDAQLPEAVASGAEPFVIVGAIAGG